MQISGDRVPRPPQRLVPIPEALWISQIENSRCKVFLVYIIIYLLHFLSIILALAHLPFARTLYCRQTVTRTVRIVLPIAFYALFTSSSSAVGLLVLDGCAQLDPNHSLWTISPQIKSLFRSTLCHELRHFLVAFSDAAVVSCGGAGSARTAVSCLVATHNLAAASWADGRGRRRILGRRSQLIAVKFL